MQCCFGIKRKSKQQAKDGRPGATRASAETPPRPSFDNAGGPQTLDIDLSPETIISHPVPPIPIASRPVAIETSLTPISNYDPPPTKAANFDIWADAYDKFAKREPELAEGYKTHLTTLSITDFSNADWVKSTVEQLQKNREDKQWHVTFHGKDIKFRTQAERLAKVLVWCDGIVKNALSAQPYAALAWSGVSIFLPLLTAASAQNDAMLDAFDEINRVQIYWKAYQDIFTEQIGSDGNDVVRGGLVNLYSHIFEYQARIICHLSSTQLSRAWELVAGWNKWKDKASHVYQLSEHCKNCVGLVQARETQEKCDQQLKQMDRSREALRQIYEILEEERKQQKKDHQDQQERELLADLAADHEGYKNFNPPKVENTCGWFLEHESFRTWRDSGESSFLWVSAGPGCGKSVLSRSLIDEWQLSTSAATSTVCYFFFKDGGERRQSSANALSAILHQLFIQDMTGKFMSHALHRHKNYGKALTTNFSELWNILLDCATTPDAGEIVCVIDALDECNQNDRNNIIGKLKDFFSSTGGASRRTCRLKFFVTSRPYDTIEQSIGSFLNSSCLRIDGDDHSAAVSEDINRVIDAKVPDLLKYLSEDNRRRISERLKGMKNRTYLWLRLTFYLIEQNPVDYNRPSDVEALLNNLPNEHSEAYEKILNQKNSKYTRPLLQLILAAQVPLTAAEANYALTIATADIPFTSGPKLKKGLWDIESFQGAAKNFCGLLIDFHDSKLSFIHQTVREFLTECPREDGEWNWRGRFKLSECHRVMSFSCIHYLSLLDTHSGDRANYRFDPFFLYAVGHWVFHYREQDHNTCADMIEKARNLFRPHMREPIWATDFCSNDTEDDLVLATQVGLVSVVL
ncbi:hypothetical protein F5Y12DRAFT_739064 [Xylaria sp. FL1777]|nr:hypothetical protein F5Y12DRAFT_739064 [Xylaria sp. FL1777]